MSRERSSCSKCGLALDTRGGVRYCPACGSPVSGEDSRPRAALPGGSAAYRCPICPDETLTVAHRAGIEIEVCPRCRGVWLDRGELAKMIERSAGEGSWRGPRDGSYDDDDDDDAKYRGGPGRGRRKRKSLLGDIFDELFD